MEIFALVGSALIDPISAIASILAISQFLFGVARNRQDLSEIKLRATEDKLGIYVDKNHKELFKPAYQTLAKSAPYAQRIIITLQIRAAVYLMIAIIIMFGTLHGIGTLGKLVADNPWYSMFVIILFITAVKWWIPNLSNVLSQARKLFTNEPSDESLLLEERYARLKEKSSSQLRSLSRNLGIIPLSKQEKDFMSAYLVTLEIVRSIEASYLCSEMDLRQRALIQWVDNESSKHNK